MLGLKLNHVSKRGRRYAICSGINIDMKIWYWRAYSIFIPDMPPNKEIIDMM